MASLGIDLGAHSCVVAYVNDRHTPELVPDAQMDSGFGVRSLVHVGDGACAVGGRAERIGVANRKLKILQISRDELGRQEPVFTDETGRNWGGEVLTSLLLRKLRADGCARLNADCKAAALAVPASFTDYQRLALIAAAHMAGFEEIAVVDEPVAAVTCHLQHNRTTRPVLVCDFGYDRLAVSVVKGGNGVPELVSATETRASGTAAADCAMVEQLSDCYRRQFHGRVPSVVTQEAFRRFATEVRNAMVTGLRDRMWQVLACDGDVMEVCYTRRMFEDVARVLLGSTIDAARCCLENAALEWSGIDAIVVTGGDPILPLICQRLTEASGLKPERILSRQSAAAVAYGAAIIADSLHGRGQAGRVVGHDIGIRTYNPGVDKIETEWLIRKGSSLPAETVIRFAPQGEDGDDSIVIDLVQAAGGQVVQELSASIDIDADADPTASISVRFRFCGDGLLSVTVDGQPGPELLLNLDEKTSDQVFINRHHGWISQISEC
jgi:molecular chaperone DnaK